MANHGAKFQSVNLNKSYGQQHQSSHHTFQRFGGGGGFYGQATAAGRSRGGGGGMVVLSRNRSTPAKVAPKLSVPPPLNLPSLRKEHEKFDMLGPGGPGSGAGAASGPRPTSSGPGWTKTVATGYPEKNESAVGASGVDGKDVIDGASRTVGSYMPPSARVNAVGVVGAASASLVSPPYSADKTVVLRGEDFPSLQAARPVSSDSLQKQKDGLNQKQKHVIGEESAQENRGSYHLESLVDVQKHLSSRIADGNGVGEYGGKGQGLDSAQMAYRIQKEQNLQDPLPLVNVIPRSDWADDERDTGHGFVERGRHVGLSNHESYWDRDFDLPRASVLPRKPAQNQFGRWGQHDNETGKKYSSEVLKTDPYNKDSRASHDGKEDDRWRTSTSAKDRFSSQDAGRQRGDVGAMMAGHSEMVKENKNTPPHSGDIGQNDGITVNWDSASGKKDLRHVEPQQRYLSTELYNNRGSKQRNGSVQQPSMYRGDDFQNNSLSKSSAAFRRKLPPVTDPILTMDRRFARSDTSFSEDPFLRDFGFSGFDERDLFSGGLVGVIKRKKDASRSTEFHDPVRESFEAELERVQKMQELERQKIVEEQERALEQARREEEERQSRIREEEELQQRLEKEAQEAAGRAEQERLEAIRRAEEQRIAREEERRIIQEEEERRKQAAKQKLLELEAKMAKREAQVSKDDVPMSKTILNEKLESIQENHILRNMDLDTWEDSKRTVENVTMSGTYDSSAHGRAIEMNPEPYPFTESSVNFTDRGKGNNSWRRDAFVNGGSISSTLMGPVIGHYSPRRDTFDGGRAAIQKEFRGGAMPSGAFLETRMREPYSKELGFERDNRWNLSGNISSYGKQREMDSEFSDGIADMYGDSGWGQGSSHGNSRPPYSETLYPHSGDSEFHSYGRSRFSMRQPRVLPPPIGSAKRTNFNGVSEHDDPSTFVDSNHYAHAARAESHGQTDYYGSNQRGFEPSEVLQLQQDNTASEEQKLNDSSRCYSQSSLSVSSPPVSPPQLSHDELDEFGDSPVMSVVAEGKASFLTGIVTAVHSGEAGKNTTVIASAPVSVVEDEEWTLENDDKLLRQEEYYEDVDGSREEGDECEMGVENLDLNQKFGGLELEERLPSQVGDNVVIGFDQGIQVVIPSDDFEDNSRAQERSCGIPVRAVGIMEETGAIDGYIADEQFALPAEDSLETTGDRYLENAPENGALQDSIFQPVGAPCSSAMENLLDGADTSASTGLAAQGTIPSSDDDGTAAVRQREMASLSSGSQGDIPVNLQFGLFSGPSLIPSPVPTIQIGSIQMPLHIHPFGTSVAHMPSSQPSVFQFGQVHYSTPISQGILSMTPQSMPFVQPNMMGDFNLNQNARCSVAQGPAPDASSQMVTKDEVPPLSLNKSPSFLSASPDQSNGRPPQVLDSVLDAGSPLENTAQSSSSGVSDKKMKLEYGSQAEEKVCDHTVTRYTPSKSKESENQSYHLRSTIHSLATEKNVGGHRGAGSFSGGRGRRVAYAVKNANTRSFFQDNDVAGFQRRPRRTVQRTEFRIRQNTDKRSSFVLVSSSAGSDDKLNYEGKSGGVFSGSGSKRSTTSARSTKQRLESESSASGNPGPQNANSGDRAKELAKNLSTKSRNTFHPDEANSRNSSEEVVDAPLQSGVVHVFKQPGIEAPSDEDDFIEVRSKRQMLNDRREQKEKEIKEKSRATKSPRKPHAARQKDLVSSRHKNIHVPVNIEKSNHSQLEFTASDGPHFSSNEVSTGFVTTVSQPKIGTPAPNSEPKATKPHQVESVPAKMDCDPGLTVDTKHQTQFDEAMQLAGYDLPRSAVGDHSSTFSDPILPASSSLPKDKSYSSGASPANSLIAEDQIQYGSKRSDLQLAHSFSVSEKDNPHYPRKEKLQIDSCVPLQDCEAEAEAAASAVAVAAISSDEVARKGLSSVNDTKSFGSAGIDGIATGVVGDQHLPSQSCSDELLSVSLPADLSVETTPISLWPPVQSPQSSSSPMISHFAGGPPSSFPFYEMNPVLGGPIFSSTPQEDSLGSSQPQKSAALNSRPLGNWQQFQSGVDSFYCPPAGYSAPFIGAPGGIPGVQGPPHMVLYNHFAPVGQYGHVGLSYMGTTFIPTGKQADWKNTSTSSSTSVGDGDINNTKIITGQRHAPNVSASVQHLAPGSPLLPMPSPLPMFDVSSFQIASDLPVPTHWGHIPASPLHSVPVSQPLQPQGEGAVPSQVNQEHTADQSLSANVFSKSRTPMSDNGSSPTIVADKNVVPFPAELGPVGPSVSSMASSVPSVPVQSSSGISETGSGKNQNTNRFHQKSAFAQQGNVSTGSYQRGGSSQRTNTKNEWTHRRTGFHGRDQSGGKGFRGSKMKQIYVAKQTTTSSSAT